MPDPTSIRCSASLGDPSSLLHGSTFGSTLRSKRSNVKYRLHEALSLYIEQNNVLQFVKLNIYIFDFYDIMNLKFYQRAHRLMDKTLTF